MTDTKTEDKPKAVDPKAPYGSANNPSEFDVLQRLSRHKLRPNEVIDDNALEG